MDRGRGGTSIVCATAVRCKCSYDTLLQASDAVAVRLEEVSVAAVAAPRLGVPSVAVAVEAVEVASAAVEAVVVEVHEVDAEEEGAVDVEERGMYFVFSFHNVYSEVGRPGIDFLRASAAA